MAIYTFILYVVCEASLETTWHPGTLGHILIFQHLIHTLEDKEDERNDVFFTSHLLKSTGM